MNFPMFRSRDTSKSRLPPSNSLIDRLTYAIGDIHGRNDLLTKMLDTIRSEADVLGEKPRIVMLGDYIDRGPASADVLATVVALRTADWCDAEILLGNHELFLLKFALDASCGPQWLEYGGTATLQSYGLTPPLDRTDPAQWQALLADMVRVIPREHLRLLCEAKIYFIAGDYLFVHGGVKPGMPIEEQSADTMLWIREEFLAVDKSCDYVVVHGHSAKEDAHNLPWRIGVDTGAYATGVLSAVRLSGRDREIIQVTR